MTKLNYLNNIFNFPFVLNNGHKSIIDQNLDVLYDLFKNDITPLLSINDKQAYFIFFAQYYNYRYGIEKATQYCKMCLVDDHSGYIECYLAELYAKKCKNRSISAHFHYKAIQKGCPDSLVLIHKYTHINRAAKYCIKFIDEITNKELFDKYATDAFRIVLDSCESPMFNTLAKYYEKAVKHNSIFDEKYLKYVVSRYNAYSTNADVYAMVYKRYFNNNVLNFRYFYNITEHFIGLCRNDAKFCEHLYLTILNSNVARKDDLLYMIGKNLIYYNNGKQKINRAVMNDYYQYMQKLKIIDYLDTIYYLKRFLVDTKPYKFEYNGDIEIKFM